MPIDLTFKNFLDLIPDYVINIAEELQKNNFEAFLVGGSIRDILLGKKPGDYDIATNAYPEEISKIFPKSVPTGAKFGTIVVVGEDFKGERFDVEVTTYRSEADYVGGRWPSKVEFTTHIEDDLSRRDFTINAIALDLQNFDVPDISIQQILVDPYGGLTDLKNGIIKAVRDPMERMSEDGLRAVRGCRLASQLQFKIDSNTFDAIKKTNHITEKVSVERFRDEFIKILERSPKPSIGIILLKNAGILKIFIPELLEGIEVVQPRFHKHDVFDHSLKACDLAEDNIKLAALFHDVAKPRTYSKDSKGVHFYGHDVVGADMTKEILTRLRFPKSVVNKVARLVRWHMFYYPSSDYRSGNPGFKVELDEASSRNLPEKIRNVLGFQSPKKEFGWSDGAIRRLIKNVGGEEQIDDLMKLRIADATSNPKHDFNPKEIRALANRIAEVRQKEMALKVEDLDITGDDLIKELQLSPGPRIGSVLNHLLEIIIEDPIKNEKKELLNLAKKIIK